MARSAAAADASPKGGKRAAEMAASKAVAEARALAPEAAVQSCAGIGVDDVKVDRKGNHVTVFNEEVKSMVCYMHT